MYGSVNLSYQFDIICRKQPIDAFWWETLPPTRINLLDVSDNIIRIETNFGVVSYVEQIQNTMINIFTYILNLYLLDNRKAP